MSQRCESLQTRSDDSHEYVMLVEERSAYWGEGHELDSEE